MKTILRLLIISSFISSCGQKPQEQTVAKPDSTNTALLPTVDNHADLFLDSCFTFLDLDSINEEMLRDRSIKGGYKYIKSVKRFSKQHCVFFRTGCHGYFVDDHVFLISKQNPINGITSVIIHDSKDFDYYHSVLYTLDKNYMKVDSLIVSLLGSDMAGDEPPYSITKARSKFDKEFIITTELEYNLYDKDSIVTVDSTVVYRKIQKDGHIAVVKTEKLI
jgi:hypothetical protein